MKQKRRVGRNKAGKIFVAQKFNRTPIFCCFLPNLQPEQLSPETSNRKTIPNPPIVGKSSLPFVCVYRWWWWWCTGKCSLSFRTESCQTNSSVLAHRTIPLLGGKTGEGGSETIQNAVSTPFVRVHPSCSNSSTSSSHTQIHSEKGRERERRNERESYTNKGKASRRSVSVRVGLALG